MRLLARLFMVSLAAGLFFIVSAKSAHAEGEFQTDYDVVYQVDTSGVTNVTQKIVLTNKTENYYADKFELKIGSTKVADVKASDDAGPLDTKVTFDNNITTITVKFNQRVIGSGKTLPWTLTYSSAELATKSGQIWEISIPKLASSPDMGTYNAAVNVPRTFGSVAFAVPAPALSSQKDSFQQFTFSKEQLLSSGISMSFGEKQVFSFKLNYFLENNNVTSQVSQITLPPDNNYQRIVLQKIEPSPLDVTVDSDGNFEAKFKLQPKQKLNITAEGYTEVFSKPFRKIEQNLTDEQKNLYTQPQRYWETDNAFIKDKANELKTPQEIYKFVSSYLTYSNSRLSQPKIERKGAAAAIQAPTDSICMEFTDLFIAIARAAKIPAREVEGYAYTQNERLRPLSLTLNSGDVLHAWPEYWDDNLGWVQVDPTWGSTSGGLDYFNKLDFNHITFIQRGVSSTSPLPAGAFKEESKSNEKSVFVEFAKDFPAPTSSAKINLEFPQNIYSGIPVTFTANIQNDGTTSIIDRNLALSAQILKTTSSNPVSIPILPPFANRDYRFQLQANNVVKKTTDNLIVSYGDVQKTQPILVKPFYEVALSPVFAVAVLAVTMLIIVGLRQYGKLRRKRF